MFKINYHLLTFFSNFLPVFSLPQPVHLYAFIIAQKATAVCEMY